MKVRMILFTFFIASFSGCNSEEDFAVALHGNEKLAPGTTVPFLLQQNYPNPFNPSTVIGWSLTARLHIRLRVMTEDWHDVATLVDAVTSPGRYVYTFVSGDLASGVYYYVMEGGGYTEIRAMRIVK